MAKKRLKINQQITKVFEGLLDEYLHDYEETKFHVGSVDSNDEGVLIKDFLVSPCSCGKACKNSLGLEEIAKSRKKFSSLSWVEKNAFMLSQLSTFMRRSDKSHSARQIKTRVRQKFDYHIIAFPV